MLGGIRDMVSEMRSWVLAIGTGIFAGCGGAEKTGHGPQDNPSVVRDVTDVEFAWRCDDHGCDIGALETTPPPNECGSGKAAYSYRWGRFFDICSVCLSDTAGIHWSTTAGECRILACDENRDCPLLYEYAEESIYECSNGLCQNTDVGRYPRDPITQEQVTTLCYAVHPRAETSNPFSPVSQDVESRISAACPNANPLDSCPLPEGCRTP
jgi:hypothetical protein